MKWSTWKKIASEDGYYENNLPEYDGPAIYQLAINKTTDSRKIIKYLGKTVTLRERIISYSTDGSHLYEVIMPNLRKGYVLYYRYYKVKTPDETIALEKQHLSSRNYDWNIQNN